MECFGVIDLGEGLCESVVGEVWACHEVFHGTIADGDAFIGEVDDGFVDGEFFGMGCRFGIILCRDDARCA